MAAPQSDLAEAYLAHRTALPEASAADELLRRVEGQKPSEGTPIAPATAPSGVDTTSTSSLPVRALKDVGRGILETPRAVVKGVRDAYSNMFKMGDELSSWLEDKSRGTPLEFMNAGLSFDKSGAHFMSPEDSKNIPDMQTGDLIPDLNSPKTVTGGLVKGVAQFLTGLKGAGKLLSAAGVPEMTGAAGYSISALKGAIANFTSFDPHQQRLSNLIEKFPELSNPVTQYLESKPDDNAAEGRFKNSLEGVGLGVLTDGFFKAVKFLRTASLGKDAAEEAAQGVESVVPEPRGTSTSAFRSLGDESPTAPLVSDEPIVKPEPTPEGQPPTGDINPEDVTGAVKPDEPKVYINFARINTPEDIQTVTQHIADRFSSDISDSARGKQSFEQIKLNAGMEDAWNILQNRRVGEPLNAEQSVAVRELWASSAEKLQETAQLAVSSPTEENLFAFRKMMATHYGIQNQVIGARTETARALASWNIPVGSAPSRLRDITDRLMEAGGGADNVKEMAEKVAGMAQAGYSTEIESFVAKSAYARTRDAFIQAYTDGLLSSPVTQAKILASNVTTALWRMGERKVGEKISSILGTENGIAAGEAGAQWSGIVNGWKDALAYAWKAARTGVTGAGIGEPHEQFPSNLSADALNLSDQGWLGKGADFLGTMIGIGRQGIAAQHDAALTLAYRMELNAQAVRQATSELNGGQITDEAFGDRVAEIVANPPPNINMASVDGAKYQAFLDEPGKIAKAMIQLRQDVPALRIILPFIKIPARIFSYSMERTPLAPLMSKFRADISAGGAGRDLALAQVGLGTGIMLAAADLTMTGRIKAQGPVEKGLQQAQEREGERNWSVHIGDKWYDYNGIHPAGKLLGLAAAVTEAISNGQHELKDDADTEKMTVATTLAIAANLTNASYTQGLSNFFAMVHDNRVGGAGENAILSTVGSTVPSLVGRVAIATDPYRRAVYSMLDEFKSRIPGLSSTLPPSRDLWGSPVSSGYGPMTDLFSPAQARDAKHEPIDDEILKQGFNLTLPSPRQSFAPGAVVDLKHYPEAYSRFVELSGNEFKHPGWGVGAKDLLNSVVTGQHPLSAIYKLKSDGPDGGKEIFVRDMLNQYREFSKHQLLTEYPSIQSEVNDARSRAMALKMPVIQ